MNEFHLRDAVFPDDKPEIERMFRAYADWLGIDLGFQDFEQEIVDLPGKYAAPGGALLVLSGDDGRLMGCVALRDMGNGQAELKRMFLDIGLRGQGQGRTLGEAILDRARSAGYRRIVLDTLDYMGAALKLYDRLGFRRIAPYYNNPLPGVVYMGRDL